MNNFKLSNNAGLVAAVRGGFNALGTASGASYFWSPVLQTVVSLRPSEFGARMLKSTCGTDWSNRNYTVHPENGQAFFDHQRLADDIQSACQAAGPYSEASRRSAGAWRADDGSLVINGKSVWRQSGEQVERVGEDGFVYQNDGDLDLDPEDAPATEAEVCEFEQTLDTWRWDNLAAAACLLGWIVCGVLAGALSARPHLYITARAGTGKSALARMLGAVFGKGVVRPTGDMTHMGLLQQLRGRAIPCIVDEAEAGLHPQKGTAAAIDVARWGYSMVEGDDGVLRGSAGGVPRSYTPRSPFCFFGINLPRLGHADQTRAVVLEMQGQRKGAGSIPRLLADERYCAAMGRKLRRLAVQRWPVFRGCPSQFRVAIMKQGGAARLADTLGTFLAGYWCLKSSVAPSAEEVASLVQCLEMEAHQEAMGESDEVRCLDTLLYTRQAFPVEEWNGVMQRSLSIGDAVRLLCAEAGGQPSLDLALQDIGVRVVRAAEGWMVAVACSASHKALLRVFASTQWKNGSWSMLLRRLAVGKGSTQRIAGRPCKCVMFNVPQEFLPPEGANSSAPDVGVNELRQAA